MIKHNNKPLNYFNTVMYKNINEHIALKLSYHIKLNYQTYNIIEEHLLEDGIYVLINNDIDKKIIGIVPTKSKSIYGELFCVKNSYYNTFDEIYEIKDFTDNKLINEYFNLKVISDDKSDIYCDEQGGIIVSDFGFYTRTIPIYWGSDNIFDYFNKDRFINIPNLNSNTINNVISSIVSIINNDNLYLNMVNKPIFTNGVLSRNINDVANDMKNFFNL